MSLSFSSKLKGFADPLRYKTKRGDKKTLFYAAEPTSAILLPSRIALPVWGEVPVIEEGALQDYIAHKRRWFSDLEVSRHVAALQQPHKLLNDTLSGFELLAAHNLSIEDVSPSNQFESLIAIILGIYSAVIDEVVSGSRVPRWDNNEIYWPLNFTDSIQSEFLARFYDKMGAILLSSGSTSSEGAPSLGNVGYMSLTSLNSIAAYQVPLIWGRIMRVECRSGGSNNVFRDRATYVVDGRISELEIDYRNASGLGMTRTYRVRGISTGGSPPVPYLVEGFTETQITTNWSETSNNQRRNAARVRHPSIALNSIPLLGTLGVGRFLTLTGYCPYPSPALRLGSGLKREPDGLYRLNANPLSFHLDVHKIGEGYMDRAADASDHEARSAMTRIGESFLETERLWAGVAFPSPGLSARGSLAGSKIVQRYPQSLAEMRTAVIGSTRLDGTPGDLTLGQIDDQNLKDFGQFPRWLALAYPVLVSSPTGRSASPLYWQYVDESGSFESRDGLGETVPIVTMQKEWESGKLISVKLTLAGEEALSLSGLSFGDWVKQTSLDAWTYSYLNPDVPTTDKDVSGDPDMAPFSVEYYHRGRDYGLDASAVQGTSESRLLGTMYSVRHLVPVLSAHTSGIFPELK